jgi:pimeloyl-ACP methyl ester carboxylesterase
MTIELAFNRIAGASSERSIAFLPGILGRGNNLRTIASRFVEARPQWTAWLVDLRGHGRSPKGTPNPSLEAAARDVVTLAASATPPLHAIVGHSFGGKVALEAARSGAMASLEHVVVIDSVPGVRSSLRGDDSALAVIEAIE